MTTSRSRSALRVAVLVDPMGCGHRSDDDEFEAHCASLRDTLSERELRFERLYCFDDAKVLADLVVFDFGGMMMGNDLLGSNSRALLRWLDDHPSALVVVVSEMSFRNGIEYELDGQQLRGRQIIAEDDALNNPRVRDQIRRWAETAG